MLCHGYFSDFYFAAFFFMLKGERLCTIKQRSFNKSVETNVCGCWWFIIKRGKKWENLRKLLCSVLQLDQNKRVFSIWLLAARFLALFPSRSASWTVPNFSFFTGPELWMISSSFPSHKKNPSSSSPKNTARPWNTASFSAAPHQSSCWTWSKPKLGRKRSCLVEASSHVGLLEMSSSQKEQKSSLSLPRDFSSALITLFLFFFLWGRGEGMDVVF